MATITATTVKELRDKTGAGMMDCKAALAETGGDMEAAVDWLRAKGLAKAAKKAGRVAAEGLIGLAAETKQAALVEVNSETDFVARNPHFQEMVSTIAGAALKASGNLDQLATAAYGSGKATVADTIKEMIGSIGENMTLRRAAHLSVAKGAVASYMHNMLAPGLGKIGVIVALDSAGDEKKLAKSWQADRHAYRRGQSAGCRRREPRPCFRCPRTRHSGRAGQGVQASRKR